jgi:hypothetical protein
MLTRIASTLCAAGLLTGLLAATPIAPPAKGRPEGTMMKPERAPASGAGDASTPSTTLATGGSPSGTATDAGLKPRTPMPKVSSSRLQLPSHPLTGRPSWNGRLVVKFRDDLKYRADVMPAETVRDRDGRPVEAVAEILKNFGGTVRSLTRRSPSELRQLERRSETRSGTQAADLAGIVYVDVSPDSLLAAAKAFNDLDIVEYVDIQRTPEQHRQNFSTQYGCGVAGPDSGLVTGINNCYTASVPPQGPPNNRCSALGGGGACNNVGGCANPAGQEPTCRFGCNHTACCNLISGCLPNCADEEQGQGWDAICATYANVLCAVYNSVYDAGGPQGGDQPSVPQQYKYDPCFAMRGTIVPAGGAGGRVLIQGQAITPDTANNLSYGLMTYTINGATGAFVAGTDTLDAVDYPNGTILDEADPSTGVPQKALPDPSLEGAGALLMAGCFTPHPLGGCNQVTCCVFVCRTDPACCLVGWDDNCVSIANNAEIDPVFGSPCATGVLPSTPGVFPNLNFPNGLADTTPLLTGGRTIDPITGPGNARGYQVYTVGQPVIEPFAPPPLAYPVPPPTQPSYDPLLADPTRTNSQGNLGTLAGINSGYRGGGLDMEAFDNALSALAIDPVTRGRGQGTTVAVIDLSAYVDHEDLINVVVPEPNQTIILLDTAPIDPNHGTAVLGVIGAEDNDFGITGIAHGATLRFYPSVSIEEGERLESAMTNAIIDLVEGDIICLPIGLDGNTILANPTVDVLVQIATTAGITTVVSAGNTSSEIVAGTAGNGAIVVSACWPGYRVGTAPTFSAVPGGLPGFYYCRFQQSNFGVASTVSAWGAGVATLGYGDLFNGDNPPADPTDPPAVQALTQNRLRSYTSGTSFEGTSPACAIIAGWCACLQGFSEAFFGTSLPPSDLTTALTTVGNFFQPCGLAYGTPVFPGYPEGCPQYGDIISGGTAARIGGFPRAPETVSWIVANAFSGANPVDFDVITGTYVAGSAFALRELDGVALQIASVRKRAGNRGQGFGTALFYPLSGASTDLQISTTSPQDPSLVTGFTLTTGSRVSWGLPVIEVVYFYNMVQKRWVAAGYTSLGVAVGGGNYSTAAGQFPGDYKDFLRRTSSGGTEIYARIYTCALAAGSYSVLHDQLDMRILVDFFGGGGGVNP